MLQRVRHPEGVGAGVPRHPEGITTALSQGQEIADTNRAAVEKAVEKYLSIAPSVAAFISLPTFPLGPLIAARRHRAGTAG